ncbi:MAG: hypothetical protein R3C17_06310 [Planctomycetaceae bacterium]
MHAFRNFACVLLAMLSVSGTAYCGRVEAIQGKRYTLTHQHGPWMILVASLSDVKGANHTDGLTAWKRLTRSFMNSAPKEFRLIPILSMRKRLSSTGPIPSRMQPGG